MDIKGVDMVNKQSFLNAVNQNIDMVRGDSLTFNFTLKGLGSEAAYTGLTVNFSVGDGENTYINLTNGDGVELTSYDSAVDTALFTVSLAPSNTKTLDVARYFYDLQIKDSETVLTLMRGYLTLLWEVAN